MSDSKNMPKKAGRRALSNEAIRGGRERIAAAARRLFAENGVQAVSIRNLASETGMSPMSFYRYFADRRAVLIQIWHDIFDSVFTMCHQAAQHWVEPEAALRAYCQVFVRYWIERPDDYMMVFCERDLPSGGETFFANSKIVQSELIWMQSQLELVCIGDPRAELQQLVSSMIGICHVHVTMPELGWPTPEAMADRLLDTICTASK
ncbi:MAG: TetR/AcrR family transcriptional regulator [Paracoccus sp.]|jgi:AcrR family transcriptional regulator|nr:TetR/AcrR family transcriptional regulator [Paracoccus sp. (in: a-proteobacteria)]